MRIKISLEKAFCLAMILYALSCIWSVRDMPFFEDYSLGPAAVPILLSSGLIAFSILIWFTTTDHKALSLQMFTSPGGKRGILLIGMLITLVFAVKFLGFWPPLFVFSVISFKKLENWTWVKAAGLAAGWILILYVIFEKILLVRMIVF